jgi:UDP-2,3-diacylglucosamine pyrophosphatase LpxH
VEPEFDDLYVVSDLHLGGLPDAPVFDSSEQLAALIQWAATRATTRRVAFVLGGDLVDFIAFPGATYFNPEHAVEWLSGLAAKGAPTAVIFEQLAKLTAVAGARLIVMIGNHDIELALPDVHEKLLSLIAPTDEARLRVISCLDGSGFRCQVGGRTVVCLHGNERDDWNAIDHGALRRFIRETKVGRKPAPLEPNAGTRLVVDIMNPIKKSLPFVDLLKPEDDAVPDVLLSLDETDRGLGIGEALARGKAIWQRKRDAAQRLEQGLLGSDAPQRGRDEAPPEFREDDYIDEDALFNVVESDFREHREPLDLVADPAGRLDTLNRVAMLFGIARERNLRQALWEAWAGDFAFSPNIGDKTFQKLDAWVGKDIDILIAGHTHLEKHLQRGGHPNRLYLNSGTWIRLIELKAEHLEGAAFNELDAALRLKSMKALDQARIAGQPLVVRRRTVVAVESSPESVGQPTAAANSTPATVQVRLRHVRDAAKPADPGAEVPSPFIVEKAAVSVLPVTGKGP